MFSQHPGWPKTLSPNIFTQKLEIKTGFHGKDAYRISPEWIGHLWKHDFFYNPFEAERANLRTFKDICSVLGWRYFHLVLEEPIISPSKGPEQHLKDQQKSQFSPNLLCESDQNFSEAALLMPGVSWPNFHKIWNRLDIVKITSGGLTIKCGF